MTVKLVGAPNRPVLIVAGLALFLFAAAAIETQDWYDYRLPVAVLAIPTLEYAILGTALLTVAILRSRFASVTAVIIATFITADVVIGTALPLVFGGSVHVNWRIAINLAIAAAIFGASVFPWSWPGNKPLLIWMGLTFGAMIVLTGTVILLARL
jgi:hypothetical protein